MVFLVSAGLIFLGGITVLYYWWTKRRPKNFPPGPRGLPVIGNLHQLGLEPHYQFIEWAKKYGDIMAVDFGLIQAVVLNDVKDIKEAFGEPAFSGRPDFQYILDSAGGGPAGLSANVGHSWVEQRRFTLKNLRDFGFGKRTMEAIVKIEIEELTETFLRDVGQPIITMGKFNAAFLNGLWSIVTGHRYAHDDPRLLDLIEGLTTSLAQSRALSPTLFFPFLHKLLPTSITGTSKAMEDSQEKTRQNMLNEIRAHQATWVEGSPRDFIDVFITEMNKTTDPESSFYKEVGVRNLVYAMLDFFNAGGESMATIMTWAFLLLSIFPEKQKKLHSEIDRVVGILRLPVLTDRPDMPYSEAVMTEVLRYATLVPTASVHATTEDVKFHGYDIPAKTVIVPNFYTASHDPKIWGDPENFRPERFLSADETKVVRHDAFISFSAGRRSCLGETLARDELFLFITSLAQRFEIGTDYPRNPKPDPTNFSKGVTRIPNPHYLVLQDRFAKAK